MDRIGIAAVLVVMIIFGLAMMGSVLGAKPKELPVALAVLDQPADLPDGGQLALGEMVKNKVLFLWLAASAFFLMQTALLNWIGIPAVGLLVLLLFFSIPVLAMAPEFMPQATQDWLYSWTPFRYAASGLRNLLYFGGGEGMALPYGVMWGIAGVGLVVVLASALRRERAKGVAASQTVLASN